MVAQNLEDTCISCAHTRVWKIGQRPQSSSLRVIPPQLQQFSTQLLRSAGLTALSSRKTSQNACLNPGAVPISEPSTETFTPSSEQSNWRIVPGVAAPFDATPSNINVFNVSTAALFVALGLTESAIAAAIFSAPTLKFIFNKNVVWVVDFKESLMAERAPALLDLEMEETLVFASSSEYIPTEYTLIGPFFLTPTPNNGSVPRLSSNLIFVAGSTNAAAASALGRR
mmetsp:Transcript_11447/g.28200  ORF Transcript_11447/g.28200 Transcript_11447/m.28200 type:complete len:227 (-) Transcript_11447:271-951(-)